MKKSVLRKKTKGLKFSLIILFSGGIVYFSLAAFGAFTQAAQDSAELSILGSQYKIASQKVEKLIKQFPGDIFYNPLLKKLEHSFKLPLKAEPLGKENPFELPLPPEQLLNL